MPLPAIRMVDAYPVTIEGKTLFGLNDPSGYVEEQVILYPGAFFVAASLDGNTEATDIQAGFAKKFAGKTLSREDLMKVVEHLDEKGFLQTPKFNEIRKRIDQAFKDAKVRKAFLAGKSYADDPVKLKAYLDSLFEKHAPTKASKRQKPLKLLISPHIDFERGQAAYVQSYTALRKSPKPDVVYIFGVSHQAPPHPFVLTQKHFQTPLGTLATDSEIVKALSEKCAWNAYGYEQLHRTEHSIEFQAVMLSYLYGSDVKIVPILCGAFTPAMSLMRPSDRDDIRLLLETLRELIQKDKRRVCVIAGVDLAHVGRRFGDDFDIEDSIMKGVEARDREDLQHVSECDAEAFYASVMKDQNKRRVCGLNSIYASLKSVQGTVKRADFLHYGNAPDPHGGLVSFTAMGFF